MDENELTKTELWTKRIHSFVDTFAKSLWKMSLTTVIILGVLFTGIGELFPVQLVQLFVDAAPEVIAAAPTVVRLYYIIYLFLGITILATYYLQSTIHDKMSMLIAILRSAVISSLPNALLGALLFPVK